MAEEDVEAIIALTAVLPTAPHWPREAYLSALKPGSGPKRINLVAETAEAELIGVAVASVIPPEAELELIAVAPGFQRNGVAGRLFESLRGELAAGGVTEMLLEVRGSNSAALSLYRALGFDETGRRLSYYAHPTEDAVHMRLGIG